MTSSVLLFLHEALCLVLWYTIFCRSVKTDKRVRADVRAAFVLLGYVALAGVVAPLAWAWEPDAWGLALLAAIVILQLVTAADWAHGVPDRFINPDHVPKRRRATDRDLPTCQK